MKFHIQVQPKKIKKECFNFGNIDSRLEANSLYFTLDGKPYIPISGEFHFSRYDQHKWKKELLKMRASGINTVATYVFWNHHEYDEGQYNFSGNMDIKKFLTICKEIDMPCVLRMGPWSHGECLYGGFPKYIQKMSGKRSDNPKYLKNVEKFWTRLFEEVKDFCDGKTIIAIQLENEYTGNISHIFTLKKLAIKIGYKTPFFTMTAWPTNTPDMNILPTFGGYPEAPWTWHKKPLSPNFRFNICEGRTESEIGEDLIKTQVKKASFEDFPYVGCEVGVGNQVTQHRRPIINANDGYGVAFAKFASGMNWIGYYMYHGGRNPNNHLYQESKRTLYPNNYPIIDYDFQSPFGKNGEKRKHCDRLRLLHTFIASWDSQLATKQAYFAIEKPQSSNDANTPYCSVRCDENLSGYAFISNYERGRIGNIIEKMSMEVCFDKKCISLPTIDVPKDAIFFYPFNFDIAGKHIDFVVAQPITKTEKTYYFAEIKGIKPKISFEGKIQTIDKELMIGDIKIVILPYNKAQEMYLVKGKVIFAQGNIYVDSNDIKSEAESVCNMQGIEFGKIERRNLPYNHFLFSYRKRSFYSLKIDKKLLEKDNSLKIEFDFVGLNLQVFCGETLIDDYFNTDGKYSLYLNTWKDYLLKNNELVIKAASATKFGVGNVYNEINMPIGKVELKIKRVVEIKFGKN